MLLVPAAGGGPARDDKGGASCAAAEPPRLPPALLAHEAARDATAAPSCEKREAVLADASAERARLSCASSFVRSRAN